MAGRQELVKIQTIRTHEEVNGSTETNTVPITRARRGSGGFVRQAHRLRRWLAISTLPIAVWGSRAPLEIMLM